MKKRNFLIAGTGFLGAIGLSRFASKDASTDRAIAKPRSQSGSFEIAKPDSEWRKTLTPEQYEILRQQGTEPAGSSPLDKEYGKGIYVCAGCELPLFSSDTKFNSHTGWPSFYAPIEGSVGTTTDKSLFMTRVEVHCHRCGGHLGHVFDDGPKPTGDRYCMNGVAMQFIAGRSLG